MNYEPIASINLPRGRYLLIISFFVKATGTWMYLYKNNGENLIQNGGFYVNNSANFIPFVVRTVHTVNNDK